MKVLDDVIKIRKRLDKVSADENVNVTYVEEMLAALKNLPMTVDVLKESKIGLTLNLYRKNHKDTRIGSLAKELREHWMRLWESDFASKKKNKSNSKPENSEKLNDYSEQQEGASPSAAVVREGECVIVTLKGLMCITQRARFDVTVSTDNLELSGKSSNYKIPLSSIQNLFLLPDTNDVQYYFIMELDAPIKRGKTEYKLFVFTLSSRVSLVQELYMNQTELDLRYGDRLKKHMQGLEHKVISSIIEVVANKKLITTDFSKGSFINHSISCSFKSDSGHLYPLDNCFIFLPKPSLHIKFEDIKSVDFSRSDGYNRSFDFFVNISSKKSFHFGIEKDKYDLLQNFLRKKNLT